MDSSRVETRTALLPALAALRERIYERITFENRILILSLAIAVPGFLATVVLLWTGNYSTRLLVVVTIIMGVVLFVADRRARGGGDDEV